MLPPAQMLIKPALLSYRINKSFGCQRRTSPLCDDLPEVPCKVVAVTRQPLIKGAVRPFDRLLSRLLVLGGFELVLF
jgi:hypothetical protein